MIDKQLFDDIHWLGKNTTCPRLSHKIKFFENVYGDEDGMVGLIWSQFSDDTILGADTVGQWVRNDDIVLNAICHWINAKVVQWVRENQKLISYCVESTIYTEDDDPKDHEDDEVFGYEYCWEIFDGKNPSTKVEGVGDTYEEASISLLRSFVDWMQTIEEYEESQKDDDSVDPDDPTDIDKDDNPDTKPKDDDSEPKDDDPKPEPKVKKNIKKFNPKRAKLSAGSLKSATGKQMVPRRKKK